MSVALIDLDLWAFQAHNEVTNGDSYDSKKPKLDHRSHLKSNWYNSVHSTNFMSFWFRLEMALKIPRLGSVQFNSINSVLYTNK